MRVVLLTKREDPLIEKLQKLFAQDPVLQEHTVVPVHSEEDAVAKLSGTRMGFLVVGLTVNKYFDGKSIAHEMVTRLPHARVLVFYITGPKPSSDVSYLYDTATDAEILVAVKGLFDR